MTIALAPKPPAKCATCRAVPGPTGRIKHRIVRPVPSLDDLERWSEDGECETTDGCVVEPDGRCEHGHPSWMLVLGFV